MKELNVDDTGRAQLHGMTAFTFKVVRVTKNKAIVTAKFTDGDTSLEFYRRFKDDRLEPYPRNRFSSPYIYEKTP